MWVYPVRYIMIFRMLWALAERLTILVKRVDKARLWEGDKDSIAKLIERYKPDNLVTSLEDSPQEVSEKHQSWFV